MTRPPKDAKTAIVVGGGIVGLATAYALTRDGIAVTVIDAGPADKRASTATAGIIGGSSVIPWASSALWPRLPSMLVTKDSPLRMKWPPPKGLIRFVTQSIRAGRPAPRQASAAGLANLGLRGWDAWQTLMADLPAARDLFVQNTCLFCYSTPEAAAADVKANALRRSFGMAISDLTESDMTAQLPPLARPLASGACVMSAGHVVDPTGLQQTLADAILRSGGQIIEAKVTNLGTTDNRITSVTTADATYGADTVILSAGSGSATLAKGFGVSVPMVPAWGASVTFTSPSIQLKQPLLFLTEGIAITPSKAGLRVSGLLQVGGAGKAETMKSTLIAQARRVFGDFRYAQITSTTGPRPLTADSLPVLGPDRRINNLFYNFGHGHWGLTQASVSGLVTADLVSGRSPRIDIEAYAPDR